PIDFRSPGQPGSQLPYTEFSQRELDAAFASRVDFSPDSRSGGPLASHRAVPVFGGKAARADYHPPLQFGEFSLRHTYGPPQRLPFGSGAQMEAGAEPPPEIDAAPFAGTES